MKTLTTDIIKGLQEARLVRKSVSYVKPKPKKGISLKKEIKKEQQEVIESFNANMEELANGLAELKDSLEKIKEEL